jgi:putative DNA methylase
MAKEWHSRGYLPHWEAGEVPQSLTFRLADSLPAVVLERFRHELAHLEENEAAIKRRIRIDHALDSSYGHAWLADPRIAELVEYSLLYSDGDRYRLHAWTIMPNHVHVLATPLGTHSLSEILQVWKSFTARKANEILRRKGTFWAPEYFDRAIREEVHFENALAYVVMNPVKAGLCDAPEEWRFSSVWRGRAGEVARAPREASA